MKFDNVMHRPVRLAAVVLIAAVLSGCAGSSTPGGGAGAPTSSASVPASGSSGATASGASAVKRNASGAVDPCALLTPALIEAAIGTPVVATIPYGDIECRWTVKPLPAFPGSENPWLDVQFWPTDTQMLAVEAAPETKGVVAIDGLGDRAFRTNQYHHLWVKHGSDVFVIGSRLGALTDESATTRAAAEAIEVLLARLVLDQL